MLNRNELLSQLPSAPVFYKMDRLHQRREIENLAGAILDAVVGRAREPDEWECQNLCLAFGQLLAGWMNVALSSLLKATAPSPERGYHPNGWTRGPETPTVVDLQHALNYLCALPECGSCAGQLGAALDGSRPPRSGAG